MNVCSFEFVRVVAGGLFGNIMPVYLDQLGQRVGALFFLVMERRDPAEPSESVNCTVALLRHAFFFFFLPYLPKHLNLCQAQNSCVAHKGVVPWS